MTAIVGQLAVTDFTARMRENPRVVRRRILEFAAEAKVRFWDLRFGVGEAAFGAVPGGLFSRDFGGDWETCGGACGRELGRLAGPGLDAEEVEEREAEGRAGPGRIRGADSFETYKA